MYSFGPINIAPDNNNINRELLNQIQDWKLFVMKIYSESYYHFLQYEVYTVNNILRKAS